MPTENAEECLARGRDLASKVTVQIKRCTVALSNKQEAASLEKLQREFVEWEQEAVAAGISPEKEFGAQLKVLRPAPVAPIPFNLRSILTAEDLWNIGTQRPEPRKRKDPNMPLEDW